MARSSTTRVKGDGRGRLGGGRQKGTHNKISAPLREALANFCTETWDEFVTSFHRIDEPKDKCKIWLEACSYNVAKLASIDVKEEKVVKTYQDEINELMKER